MVNCLLYKFLACIAPKNIADIARYLFSAQSSALMLEMTLSVHVMASTRALWKRWRESSKLEHLIEALCERGHTSVFFSDSIDNPARALQAESTYSSVELRAKAGLRI